MNQRPFMQVDVFTDTPFRGNPVAVVLDARGLDGEQMQSIARWTNLSETTFVLPAEDAAADYRLRIFTPRAELPFAGHPTLGSARALLDAGLAAPRDGRLVQQCGAGLVELTVDAAERRLWLRVPQPRATPLSASQQLALEEALGMPCTSEGSVIDVGPVWITVRVASGDALLAARPDQAAIARLSQELRATGVTAFGPRTTQSGSSGEDGDLEVRSFAPVHGVPEDPVCGSGNGCVAAYLASEGRHAAYVARQGRAIGRDGRVLVRYDERGIQIGGHAAVCVRGELLA